MKQTIILNQWWDTAINSDYVKVDGTEMIDTIYGVGGYETILTKRVDILKIFK